MGKSQRANHAVIEIQNIPAITPHGIYAPGGLSREEIGSEKL